MVSNGFLLIHLLNYPRNRRNTSGIMAPSPSYVTYFWLPNGRFDPKTEEAKLHDYFTATLLESRTTLQSGTTGLRTWLASFPLAQYLIQNPGMLLLFNHS